MLEVKNLKKRFGDFEAVKGVSFVVNEGEVLGFLGPNGAGKSTTMRMITGFLPPTAGTDRNSHLQQPKRLSSEYSTFPPAIWMDFPLTSASATLPRAPRRMFWAVDRATCSRSAQAD